MIEITKTKCGQFVASRTENAETKQQSILVATPRTKRRKAYRSLMVLIEVVG